MLLADTVAIFLVVVGVMSSLPCLWLLCRALWFETFDHAIAACEKSLSKSFYLGLPLVFVSAVAVALVGKLPGAFGQIGGVGVFCAIFLFAQIGVAALTSLIGRRLPSPIDAEKPWRVTLRGGIVLVFSYLLPIVGWFLIIPASLIIGLGTACRGWLRARRSAIRRRKTARFSATTVAGAATTAVATAPTQDRDTATHLQPEQAINEEVLST